MRHKRSLNSRVNKNICVRLQTYLRKMLPISCMAFFEAITVNRILEDRPEECLDNNNPHAFKLALSSSISFPEAAILLVSDGESQPLARSNSRSPRLTDFPSLCACSESSLTNLIGSDLNLMCLQSHSKPECR